MAVGDIAGLISRQRYDWGGQANPDIGIVHRGGGVFAIAFERTIGGPATDRWVRTLLVNNDGTFAFIHFLAIPGGWVTGFWWTPVVGDVYAITNYQVPPTGNEGIVYRVRISADGATLAYLGWSGWDPLVYGNSPILKLPNNFYAIVYRDNGGAFPNVGCNVETVYISPDGLTFNSIRNVVFDPGARELNVLTLSSSPDTGTIIAIPHQRTTGGIDDGWLTTVFVSPNAQNIAVLANLEFSTRAYYCSICHVIGDIYAIAYQGPAGTGWITTVRISSDGATLTLLASLEFDANPCSSTEIINIGGSGYVIIFHTGLANEGYISVIEITNNGLNLAVHDTLHWNIGTTAQYGRAAHLPDSNIYVLPHVEAGNQGWVATFEIDSYFAPIMRTDPATEVT